MKSVEKKGREERERTREERDTHTATKYGEIPRERRVARQRERERRQREREDLLPQNM